MDKVVANIDIFGLFVEIWVLCKGDYPLVIPIYLDLS
jgi:hypothetical protein